MRQALIVAAVLGLAGAAQAKERLVIDPYPADKPWKEVLNQATEDLAVRELVPADQTESMHSDILILQANHKLRHAVTPDRFLTSVLRQTQNNCQAVLITGPKAVVEDGRDVAYGQAYCGRRKGQPFGMSIFFKVVDGDDALYLIERDIIVPPTDTPGGKPYGEDRAQDAMALMRKQGEAGRYLLTGVRLCTDDSADPKCKPGG
jgi:hypothetical protein